MASRILPEAAQAEGLALRHLVSLQQPDGCWEGEVVWCPMILAQYVIVRTALGQAGWDGETRAGMRCHFEVTRTPEGGWGLHRESSPYVFVTALAYVALRLLGASPEDPLLTEARDWLHRQPGGVAAVPTWGKLWLAFCGLYGYEGVNPSLPELWRSEERRVGKECRL